MNPGDGLESNYRYVVLAARRARQLQSGSQPLVPTHSTKACRVAQDEIAAGKVKFTVAGLETEHEHAQPKAAPDSQAAEPSALASEPESPKPEI